MSLISESQAHLSEDHPASSRTEQEAYDAFVNGEATRSAEGSTPRVPNGVPESAFAQHGKPIGMNANAHLGTITEQSSNNEADPSLEAPSVRIEPPVPVSPVPSGIRLRICEVSDKEPGSRLKPPLFADAFLSSWMSSNNTLFLHTRKCASREYAVLNKYCPRQSEAVSACRFDSLRCPETQNKPHCLSGTVLCCMRELANLDPQRSVSMVMRQFPKDQEAVIQGLHGSRKLLFKYLQSSMDAAPEPRMYTTSVPATASE